MNRHAKFLLNCIAIVFAHASLLAGENKPIQELNLDEHTVYTVPRLVLTSHNHQLSGTHFRD